MFLVIFGGACSVACVGGGRNCFEARVVRYGDDSFSLLSLWNFHYAVNLFVGLCGVWLDVEPSQLRVRYGCDGGGGKVLLLTATDLSGSERSVAFETGPRLLRRVCRVRRFWAVLPWVLLLSCVVPDVLRWVL